MCIRDSLTAVVKGSDVTVEGINAAMKAAASESFGYNEDQIVSSDVIGMQMCIRDSHCTARLEKTIADPDTELCFPAYLSARCIGSGPERGRRLLLLSLIHI